MKIRTLVLDNTLEGIQIGRCCLSNSTCKLGVPWVWDIETTNSSCVGTVYFSPESTLNSFIVYDRLSLQCKEYKKLYIPVDTLRYNPYVCLEANVPVYFVGDITQTVFNLKLASKKIAFLKEIEGYGGYLLGDKRSNLRIQESLLESLKGVHLFDIDTEWTMEEEDLYRTGKIGIDKQPITEEGKR